MRAEPSTARWHLLRLLALFAIGAAGPWLLPDAAADCAIYPEVLELVRVRVASSHPDADPEAEGARWPQEADLNAFGVFQSDTLRLELERQ